MIFDEILLYSNICVLSSGHQRDFLWKQKSCCRYPQAVIMWIDTLEVSTCSHSLELRKHHERGRGLLHICHSCFCGTSNIWSWCISDTHLALGMLLLLLGCLIQLRYGCFCLIVSLSYLPVIPWRLGLFGRGNRGRVESGKQGCSGERWEEWRWGKLWLGCILWKRNLL